MAQFPLIQPTYGAAKQSNPNLEQIQMGDGYTQVLRFGLNQNPKQWSLRWEVSETDADTIETFLNARADDGAVFDWTPVDESTSYKWRCLSWNKTIPFQNRASIRATFIQFFEP
tara:strand:+ start:835 stop:1176 length:342 start_codon:yes stop_codon:yes gene_type:complete